MNIAEFNTELGKLINRAVNEGVTPNKMGLDNLVGVLELQKADVIRFAQDLARADNARKAAQSIVLPGDRCFMPPNGGRP
jgi:hypothetical protein